MNNDSMQSTASVGPQVLQLYCVMSPWHCRDPEQGTFEDLVWATSETDAYRKLAVLMASTCDSGCKTDDERAIWVNEHLDASEHLMVALLVSSTVRADIRHLLEGPDGAFDSSAKADFDTIMAILDRRLNTCMQPLDFGITSAAGIASIER